MKKQKDYKKRIKKRHLKKWNMKRKMKIKLKRNIRYQWRYEKLKNAENNTNKEGADHQKDDELDNVIKPKDILNITNSINPLTPITNYFI